MLLRLSRAIYMHGVNVPENEPADLVTRNQAQIEEGAVAVPADVPFVGETMDQRLL